MPIYNAEKFLKRSITSIIRQSIGFEKIELILVNDNSNDSTKEIIEYYSNKYHNIKSFHLTENHGYPGYGRNVGIENSHSEYIMFIDNDDEYDEKYCETMLNTINKEKCDIVCGNFIIKLKHQILHQSCFSKVTEYTTTKYNNKLIKGKITKLYDSEIWTKIFKKSIIDGGGIRFIEKGLNEDSLFLYEYMSYVKNVVYIDYYGYTWYRDSESLSTISSKTTLEFINSYYLILNFIDKHYEEFEYNRFYKNVIEGTIIRIIYSDSKKMLLKELYKFEKNINFNDKLHRTWITIINNLILKEKYSITILILYTLLLGKYSLDFFRMIKSKLKSILQIHLI